MKSVFASDGPALGDSASASDGVSAMHRTALRGIVGKFREARPPLGRAQGRRAFLGALFSGRRIGFTSVASRKPCGIRRFRSSGNDRVLLLHILMFTSHTP